MVAQGLFYYMCLNKERLQAKNYPINKNLFYE